MFLQNRSIVFFLGAAMHSAEQKNPSSICNMCVPSFWAHTRAFPVKNYWSPVFSLGKRWPPAHVVPRTYDTKNSGEQSCFSASWQQVLSQIFSPFLFFHWTFQTSPKGGRKAFLLSKCVACLSRDSPLTPLKKREGTEFFVYLEMLEGKREFEFQTGAHFFRLRKARGTLMQGECYGELLFKK